MPYCVHLYEYLNIGNIFQAQAKKEELRKQPEQIILSEVRQMVQQMQALNQQLEEAVRHPATK
jgi:hypothetical protein